MPHDARTTLWDFIGAWQTSALRPYAMHEPWHLTARAEEIVRDLLVSVGSDFDHHGDVAVHRTATIEAAAVVKGPAIVGARCFVAAGAYLRGGVWLDADCIIGPGAEMKSSFLFGGSKLAHFNFVGDSVLGSGVNLEAGSIIANYRNERVDKTIHVRLDGGRVKTGVDKFGALVGDGVRLGANAVLAPGTILKPGEIVRRLDLVDQDQDF